MYTVFSALYTITYKLLVSLIENTAVVNSVSLDLQSDNCATTMGIQVGSKLSKEDAPSIFILSCKCHSFALCANYANHRLP